MPTKKKKTKKITADVKYQAKRYPAKIRDAAAEFGIIKKARAKVGSSVLGTRKSTKTRRDYATLTKEYQKAGRKLAKLTGFEWKTRRK